ncbi:MAG: single-stranded DNA-binding protein [Anaerolineae bacterium]
MAGYQQMTIVGNVGRDVTLRYTQSGVAVADFSVAVTRKFGSGEQRQEKTLWVRVTAWRNLAETANQYVKKGQQIMVVGTVEVSAYLDKAGQPAATLELTADNFQLLGRRDEAGQGGERGDYGTPPSDLSDIPF